MRYENAKPCPPGKHSPRAIASCAGNDDFGYVVALKCAACGEIVGTGAAELSPMDGVDEDVAHLIALEEAKYEARENADLRDDEEKEDES